MMFLKAVSAARVRHLLLDDYPGATVAIGLRKLRAGYTGACIRVRRASDNTEQDIGFSGSGLDTSALASFCSGTTGFIRTWYDQSEELNDWGIATTSLQPKIYDGGFLSDGAYFDSDYLAVTTAADLGISGTTARTIFGVFKRTVQTPWRIIFVARPSTYNTGEVWIFTNEYGVRVQGGNEIYTTTVPSALEIATLTLTGTNVTDHTMRVNGSSKAATSSVSLTMNTQLTVAYIGNDPIFTPSPPFVGNIAEIILYPTNETSNHNAIEGNMNAYYNVF